MKSFFPILLKEEDCLRGIFNFILKINTMWKLLLVISYEDKVKKNLQIVVHQKKSSNNEELLEKDLIEFRRWFNKNFVQEFFLEVLNQNDLLGKINK